MAAASSSTSTRWSFNKFTSSMYSIPLCAAAIRPGSKAFVPDLIAVSISMDPTKRSSVAPTGRSTTRTWRSSGAPILLLHVSQTAWGVPGLHLYWHPEMTSISGSNAANDRTAVDFAVPFLPRIRTPPILGFIVLSKRARFIASWPTIALNGNVGS